MIGRFIYNFVKLYFVWLLCSGIFTPFFLASGIAFALLTIYLKDRVLKVAPIRVLAPWHLIKYIAWLIWEMIKSSFAIIFIIWNPNVSINPGFVEIKMKGNKGKIALLANSITLTPGTVTTCVTRHHTNTFMVHALNKDCAKSGLKDMCKKVDLS